MKDLRDGFAGRPKALSDLTAILIRRKEAGHDQYRLR